MTKYNYANYVNLNSLVELFTWDAGDLLNESDVRTNDIVPGATLQLRVWPMWTTLVEAVAQNDIEQVCMHLHVCAYNHIKIVSGRNCGINTNF